MVLATKKEFEHPIELREHEESKEVYLENPMDRNFTIDKESDHSSEQESNKEDLDRDSFRNFPPNDRNFRSSARETSKNSLEPIKPLKRAVSILAAVSYDKVDSGLEAHLTLKRKV